MTDEQTTFHFIPHIGIHVWQTDRQHFISFLILETTYDWDGQTTFHFIPHIGNHVWLRWRDISFHSWYWKPLMTETNRQHFISFLILESTYDRRTDISFHFSYWKPLMTDGQTFHFNPHIGNQTSLRYCNGRTGNQTPYFLLRRPRA